MKSWMWRIGAAAAIAGLAVLVSEPLGGAIRASAGPEKGWMTAPGDSAVVERLDAKDRVTRDVIAGRRSLLEAAAAYKALDDRGPPCPGWVMAGPPPGVSPAEYYCRTTIARVRGMAPADGAEETARTLEAELADRLGDGTLRLPGPKS